MDRNKTAEGGLGWDRWEASHSRSWSRVGAVHGARGVGVSAGYPSWASRGSAGVVRGADRHTKRGMDAPWWSGAKRTVPTAPSYTASPGESNLHGDASARLHKRLRKDEAGGGISGVGERTRSQVKVVDEDECEEEEDEDEEADKRRLKAQYQEAVRQYPDREFEKIRAEEAEAEKALSFRPRCVLLIIAPGFSETDVCMSVRVLRSALIGIELVTASASTVVQGDSGITLHADAELEALQRAHEFGAVMIPGGNASFTETLCHDGRVLAILKEFNQRRRLVIGTGAGILALHRAGVLQGRKVAAPPEIRSQLPRACLGPLEGRVAEASEVADSLKDQLGEHAWAGDDMVATRVDGLPF